MEVLETQKLQEWNLISKNNTFKCNEGHSLQLCLTTSAVDRFVQQCREKKQKKKFAFL